MAARIARTGTGRRSLSSGGHGIACPHLPRRPRVAVVSVVLALVVAACGFGGGVSTADDPLVTVETRGGECVAGAVRARRSSSSRDGRVHSAAKPPNDLGTVPPEQVAAIDAAIRLTDFEALKSHPFTGECPIAFDGQEIVFEFSTPTGPERLASCEVEIDYGLPLFVAVANALGPFVPLPLDVAGARARLDLRRRSSMPHAVSATAAAAKRKPRPTPATVGDPPSQPDATCVGPSVAPPTEPPTPDSP